MAAAAPALDGDFVGEARDDDLPAARLLRAVHGEQIAFEDAGVAHRHAAHAQQIVGARREEIGVDLVALRHVLFGEHRAAGSDATDHRQLEQAPGATAGGAEVAHLDAARGPGGNVDRAFLLERAQVPASGSRFALL